MVRSHIGGNDYFIRKDSAGGHIHNLDCNLFGMVGYVKSGEAQAVCAGFVEPDKGLVLIHHIAGG